MQAPSSTNVQRVTVTVSGTGIPANLVQDLVKIGSHWKGVINNIPVGSNHTFLAQAYDQTSGGVLLYEGSATDVTITKNQTAAILLLLRRKNAPSSANQLPNLDSVVASSNAVGSGETVILAVSASVLNASDTLTYQWSVTAGTYSSNSNTSTAWSAPPSTGSHKLNIEVKDQKSGKVGVTLMIDVQDHHAGRNTKLEVSFNNWPEVAEVTTSKARMNTGETTALDTTAVDHDNDTLSYRWASDCGGTFSSTHAKTPTFTAPDRAPTSGNCKLTVTAMDGYGGSNTGEVIISLSESVADNKAPQLTTASQSVNVLAAGGNVTLRVVAKDPENHKMTFAWSEVSGPNGTLGPPTTTATSSEIKWTAAPDQCSGSIRVTVTDDGNPNATTHHDFKVSCFVKEVSVGSMHTCAVLLDNSLKCWGNNAVGQFGNGNNTSSSVPLTINLGGLTVKQVSLGHSHTCAILSDDSLKCWGLNSFGQLGIGHRADKNIPIDVNLGTGLTAKQISAGYHHTCAILSDNRLKCWGYNRSGQLGIGDNNNRSVPQMVNLGAGLTAKQVNADRDHTCAILSDGSLKCWGYGSYGELGNGYNTSSSVPVATRLNGLTAKQVELGHSHTCALLSDNSLKCWGFNAMGQLGDGNNSNRNLPFPVDLGAGLTAKQISGGSNWTCAVLSDNSLKCWGLNDHGQLGIGNHTERNTPQIVELGAGVTARQVSAGDSHTCAVLIDGRLKCWGNNDQGKLGDGTTTHRNAPTLVLF